jgi:mRNA degradation ribonuclease J1/J2
MVPAGGAPEVSRNCLAEELRRWGWVIVDAGVKAD